MPNETPPSAAATPPANAGTEGNILYNNTPDPAAGKQVPATPLDPAKPDDKTGTEGERIVPDNYELKLPDGSLLDAKRLADVSAFAKERKLTNEEAQAVLERESALLASYVDSQREQAAQQQKEWVETVKTDKELGGAVFNKTVEMAKRVVERYGSDSFKKALNESGLGNHPELVRFVARIGKAMSEDQLVLPGSAPAAKKSLEEIFYPSQAS